MELAGIVLRVLIGLITVVVAGLVMFGGIYVIGLALDKLGVRLPLPKFGDEPVHVKRFMLGGAVTMLCIWLGLLAFLGQMMLE